MLLKNINFYPLVKIFSLLILTLLNSTGMTAEIVKIDDSAFHSKETTLARWQLTANDFSQTIASYPMPLIYTQHGHQFDFFHFLLCEKSFFSNKLVPLLTKEGLGEPNQIEKGYTSTDTHTDPDIFVKHGKTIAVVFFIFIMIFIIAIFMIKINRMLKHKIQKRKRTANLIVKTNRNLKHEIQERKQLEAKLKQANQDLQNEIEQHKITLENLQTTQLQLIQSEKMAALGQLVAGLAHEINTPLGAIRSSVHNIAKFLGQTLMQLPDFFNLLSKGQQKNFAALLQKSLQSEPTLTAREERKLKRALIRQLEAHSIEKPAIVADTLVDMYIYNEVEPYLSLLKGSESSQILQMAYKLSGLQRSSQTIETAVEQASKVVFALKNYARYDHSGEKTHANIVENIEMVLTLYHNQLKQGIDVNRKYAEIPLIMCYPDELNQVWTNLIHNALQAMAHKGTLNIEVQMVNDTIVIKITDDGVGIPDEVKPKIFEPFFTTKPPGEGSGLGLDIVKKIIDKHEGEITVTSQVGQTTFCISLPVYAPTIKETTHV